MMSEFKPGGEDLSVLLLHSTSDDLGLRTSEEMKRELEKQQGTRVVVDAIPDYKSLITSLADRAASAHIVVLLAHGNKQLGTMLLHADSGNDGDTVRTYWQELAAAAQDHLADKVLVMGICYSGREKSLDGMYESSLALSLIAPDASKAISRSDLVQLANVLTGIQKQKQVAWSKDMLDKLLEEKLDAKVQSKLVVR